MLADLMVGIEQATKKRDDVKFLSAEQLLEAAPPETRKASTPWALSAEFVHNGKRHRGTVVPDWVFALEFPKSGRRANFFVEIDRATMPVSRSDLRQTSFKKKLQTYLAVHREQQHVHRLGFRNVRILTLTTSADRITSMLAAVAETTKGRGSGMFLFANHNKLSQSVNHVAAPWVTSRGMAFID